MTGKPNRTGRNASEGHWTKLLRPTMETPAWRALPPVAQALYPWLKFEWRGTDSNNNGSIRFSVRQAAEALGVAIDTAARAFHDLQAKGFLVMTEPAVLGLEGAAKSPAFELTEIAMRGARDGRKLFLHWSEGRDYPVHKARANNPTGRARKTKPCPKNQDGTVLEIRTKLRALS
ncbi:MAG: hypothetical protein ACK5YF_00690 [Rhodobacterales bacterium]